ncbi:MAG: twin-arginine translocase TatA/TatE family subunit [Candidatus Bathyarchaeota archaeon]|nr:twin-arginine translocase TatA/TatE family subunit [Candidatus Bathyarchaeota archaeon]
MLSGWEWIVIGIVAIIIILWGPSKIPEFAKALGRAKGEFDKASKEFQEAATSTAASSNKDDTLLDVARKLGVSTEGKTKKQISAEIAEKLRSDNA